MRLVNITGGIATGKSTVSDLLQKYYAVPVIRVDEVSRTIVEPGSDALKKIVQVFGEDILQEDGFMNRAKMRKLTIHDSEKMKQLTDIMWPAMAKEVARMMNNFRRAGEEVVCVENAVSIEQGSHKHYDEVVVVTCSPDVQLKRVMKRDNQSKKDAEAMIKTQIPLEEKEKLATFLIVNDGTLATLRKQVDSMYRKIIRQEA